MSETILGASWYQASDIARVLEIPIEQAQAMLKLLVEGGRVAIAYHTGPEPAINGYTLRALMGQVQQQPLREQPKQVNRRRHAR